MSDSHRHPMGSQTGRPQTGQSSQEAEREGDVGEVPQSVQGSGNMEAVVEKQNESSSRGELFGNVGHERWQIVSDQRSRLVEQG